MSIGTHVAFFLLQALGGIAVSEGLGLARRQVERRLSQDAALVPLPQHLEVRGAFLHGQFEAEGVVQEAVIAVAYHDGDRGPRWLGIGARGSRVLRAWQEAGLNLPPVPAA